MMQHVQQRQNVRLIPTLLRCVNIVHNHVSDFFSAVLVVQEVLGKSRRSDLRQVFVLGDCEHLLLAQAAQTNAVLQRDHATNPEIAPT